MNEPTENKRGTSPAARQNEEDRAARRAAALRANLRKRKTQQRGRQEEDGAGDPENRG